jgi:hypothetical protein
MQPPGLESWSQSPVARGAAPPGRSWVGGRLPSITAPISGNNSIRPSKKDCAIFSIASSRCWSFGSFFAVHRLPIGNSSACTTLTTSLSASQCGFFARHAIVHRIHNALKECAGEVPGNSACEWNLTPLPLERLGRDCQSGSSGWSTPVLGAKLGAIRRGQHRTGVGACGLGCLHYQAQ